MSTGASIYGPDPAPKGARRSTRYPLALSVRFQTAGPVTGSSGTGVTRNLSSGGMFIETTREAEPGSQVKIIVEWPVLLQGAVPLQFIALGQVVRCNESGFGMRILRYEYRTRRKEVTGGRPSVSSIPIDEGALQVAGHIIYVEKAGSSSLIPTTPI
jgi:PilZ domain